MKKLLSLLLFSGAVLPVFAGALEIGFDKGTNPGWGFFIGMEAPGAQGNLVMMPEKVGIPALPAARGLMGRVLFFPGQLHSLHLRFSRDWTVRNRNSPDTLSR